jgi:hypothetical protein
LRQFGLVTTSSYVVGFEAIGDSKTSSCNAYLIACHELLKTTSKDESSTIETKSFNQ